MRVCETHFLDKERGRVYTVNKSGKTIAMEIVKSIIYTILGIITGIVICSSEEVMIKAVFMAGILCILAVIVVLFIIGSGKKNAVSREKTNSVNESARISRNTTYPDKPDYSSLAQSNPLDRKPMSAEKKEQRERNRVAATKVVLVNEEGHTLLEWGLQSKTSLIIGKSSDKEPVDIDLSGSAVANMISKQHAVLNYTENGWFIDDIDSKNGTRVKKASQNAIMDVKLVGAIEVEAGDIIYIANTMLQLQ